MDASQEQVPGPLPELGGEPYGAGDAFRDALVMLESAGGAYVGAAHRLAGLDAARRIVREPSLNGTGELAFTDRPTFTTLFREALGTYHPKIHLSDDVYPYLPGFELKRPPTPRQRAQNAVLLAGLLFHELDHLERCARTPPGPSPSATGSRRSSPPSRWWPCPCSWLPPGGRSPSAWPPPWSWPPSWRPTWSPGEGPSPSS